MRIGAKSCPAAWRRRRLRIERQDAAEPPNGGIIGLSGTTGCFVVALFGFFFSAFVEATFAALAAAALAGGAAAVHLGVELAALDLAVSGLAAVVAKAGEAFASTALAATAFASFAAAAGRHSAAAPRRGGAPFPALALSLSLAQGRELAFDGEGDLLGEGVLRLGLQERAHDGVAGGVLAAATAREGKHLRAAARVLHLRPDPGQARAVGVQLGPRDHDAQELQRQELLQRGRLDPILEAEPGGAYLLAEAHPSRQRCPQRRHIFGSGWVLEELGFGQAVLRRGAGPLGAEIAPEEQAALIAAAGAPKQRVVQRQGTPTFADAHKNRTRVKKITHVSDLRFEKVLFYRKEVRTNDISIETDQKNLKSNQKDHTAPVFF